MKYYIACLPYFAAWYEILLLCSSALNTAPTVMATVASILTRTKECIAASNAYEATQIIKSALHRFVPANAANL